jgi:DNA modification methylase
MDDNVWEIDRDHNANYVHPTQKPVALAARALRNSSKENEIVLDLFLGSGTTMICAEQMNRICYGMEYEPRFADEIVKRYLRYCESQNIESNVKRNGEQITLQDFEMEVADG